MQDPEVSSRPAPPKRNQRGLQELLAWWLDHWIVLACASWLAAGLLYLTLPPSPDQFHHAYMGWRLLQGDAPYRDFYDQNWPGVMALHALASWLFGVNLWSWRALDFLLFTLSAMALADIVRISAGRDAWRFSLILLPLTYVSASYLIAGQHDMSAAQLLSVALWFHVRGYSRQAARWQIGTGAFLAAAMLNKPTVGGLLILLPLHAAWFGVPARSVVLHSVVAATCMLAALLGSLGIVLGLGATLQNVLDCVYTLNMAVRSEYSRSLWERSASNIVHIRSAWLMPMTLASLPAAYWLVCKNNRSLAGTSLWVLFLAGLISYVFQGRGLNYHLATCLLSLAVGQALSIELVASGRLQFRDLPWARWLRVGFIAFSIGVLGAKMIVAFYSLPLALAQWNYDRHLSRFPTGDNDVTVVDVRAFVERLGKLDSSDCLLAVGEDSSINYLAQRKQPTRFYYSPVIEWARPPLPFAARWLDEWNKDLTNAHCHYVIISKRVHNGWSLGQGRAAESLRMLLARYHTIGTLGKSEGATVYEKRDSMSYKSP